MGSKSILKSKTFWTGAITVLISVVMLASETFTGNEQLSTWLLFASGVLTIVLRTLTNQPVSLKGDK